MNLFFLLIESNRTDLKLKMDDPPASWDQQDEDSNSIRQATNKLTSLNVNAVEFVPTFSFSPKTAAPAPTSTMNVIPPVNQPKTPPSTPVVQRTHVDREETISNVSSRLDDEQQQQQIEMKDQDDEQGL